jgi:putative membrane protein
VSDDSSASGSRARDHLANERTYLAWLRTGLTVLAVAVGVGKIAPGVASGSTWPYESLGAGFGVLGVAFVAYAYVRQRQVEAALRAGRYAPLDDRVALGLTAAAAVLGIVTVVLVVATD